MNDKVKERQEQIEETFEAMYKCFNPEAQKDNFSVQFNISGGGGGRWAFVMKDHKCDLIKNGIENPTVEISLSDDTWFAIRNGKYNSQMAFMQGKLKIKGDMNLAMKLQGMFPCGE